MVLVVSVLLGGLGADRFLIGDMGLGLLKLFTGGLFGIMWLVDIFSLEAVSTSLTVRKLKRSQLPYGYLRPSRRSYLLPKFRVPSHPSPYRQPTNQS